MTEAQDGKEAYQAEILFFLMTARNSERNNTAAMMPAGYAKAVGSDRHSGAEKKYVAETADMKKAGTAVSQKHFPSRNRYMLAVHSTIIAKV